MSDPNPTADHQTNAQGHDVRERIAREAGSGPPDRIGRFEVRRALGQGAFGCVYLAFDPNLNREVALKVPVGVTPASREEFLREARATAGITHPNVCQVFDADTAGNVPFIVSRYVGGGTLADLLRRADGRLPVADAVEITRKLALGLAAAHAKGIIHRDLKPGNVLFDDENNEVLITDFGLAKLLAHASQASAGVKGTPAYMSPEQFGDGKKAGDVGPHSDVYCLGVVFYELLTGQLPFTGSPFALMLAHIQDQPQPPSARREGLDTRLDALCLKALAKNPAGRYASAKAFAAVLADYLRNPAPPAQRTPTEAELRAQAEADYRRGQDHYNGRNGNPDFVLAREWYEKAASSGHREAQADLGTLHYLGRGVPKDDAKAREWWTKAATRGHIDAQFGLGFLHENGAGAPRDTAAALEWYEKAAAQGSAAAKAAVQRLTEANRRARADAGMGSGSESPTGSSSGTVPKNPEEKTQATADYEQGLFYQNGWGVKRNLARARAWYEKAAAQGHPGAQVNLGTLCAHGRGGPQDYAQALKWYEQAAAQGGAKAKAYLAELYENGRGVQVNRAKATELYREAAAQGDEYAKKALRRLGVAE